MTYYTGLQGPMHTGKNQISRLFEDALGLGIDINKPVAKLHIASSMLNPNVSMILQQSTEDAIGSNLIFRKSRGDVDNVRNISALDSLGQISASMFTSGAWNTPGQFGSIATRMQFTAVSGSGGGYGSGTDGIALEFGNAYGTNAASWAPCMRIAPDGSNGTPGVIIGYTSLAGANSGLTTYSANVVRMGFTGVNLTVLGQGIVCVQRGGASNLVLSRVDTGITTGNLSDGDQVGQIYFRVATSSNGTGDVTAIKSFLDGTPSSSATSGYMSFYTSPATTKAVVERMRLDKNGAISIGTNLLGTIAQLFTTAEGNSIVHQGSNSITNNILDNRVSSTVGPIQYLRKARGTFASTTDIVNGDILGSVISSAWSTSYFDTAKIDFYSDGTFTTNQRPPSGIKFYTNAANTAQTLALTIDSAQLATFAGALTVVGTTTLATSLTGLLYSTSGVVSAVAASTLIGTSPGIWAKSVTSTVVNTTTETTIVDTGVGSMTLPVNFWTVGKTIKITITGTLHGDTSVTNRLTFKLYIGGTAISGVLQTTTLNNSTYGFTVDYVVSCRSTGGSGTLTTGAVLNLDSKSPVMLTNDAVVIDTTATGALDCKVTWQSADAAASVSAFNMVVHNAY